MKTYMKRYIMAALLLAAGIGGAQATDYYVGTNQTESQANNRYKSLENLVSKAANWQTNNNTIYITSDLTVAKKIRLEHNCSIKPYGGNRTITAGTSTNFGGSNYSISNSSVFEIGSSNKSATVSLEGNDTYIITIKGLGGDYGNPDSPENWMETTTTRFARCVTVVNGTFNFTAGKLTNGYAFNGGGIYVNPDATATMSGTATITGCSAEQGGGVFNRGTFTLEGNATITKNAAWVDNRLKIKNNDKSLSLALGGGICTKKTALNDVSTMNIKGGTISLNTIEDRVKCRQNEYASGLENYEPLVPGGAGVAIYGGTVNMSNGVISQNTFDLLDLTEDHTVGQNQKWLYHLSGGGGVHVSSFQNSTPNTTGHQSWMKGIFKMTGGTITENKARRGGGIQLEGFCEVTIDGQGDNISISKNQVFKQGGAIFVGSVYAKFTANNTTFSENKVWDGGGGAIFIFASDPNTKISNSTFTKNVAEWSGGAIILQCKDGWSDDDAYLHVNNVEFKNNKSNQTLKNGHTVNSNGHAISNSGKLYLSGNITLDSSEDVPQDCCLATDLDQWHGYSRVRDHALFKEGTVSFKDQRSGKPTALDIHVLAPTDRQNIFVSTSNSTVADADTVLFNIKNEGWEDTKYFNSREMATNPKLGDIDKNYAQDKMYSGWDEKTDSKGRISTQQPTYVIELHKLGQITITNDKLRAGESAIYVVKPIDGAAGNALRQEYTVVLTGTSTDVVNDPKTVSRTIIDVEPGSYSVAEQSWNWAYENDNKVSEQWVSAGETKTYSFTGTRQSPAQKQVMYDEDIKENLFKQTR